MSEPNLQNDTPSTPTSRAIKAAFQPPPLDLDFTAIEQRLRDPKRLCAHALRDDTVPLGWRQCCNRPLPDGLYCLAHVTEPR